MACFIIPPYVLKALAVHGQDGLRMAALETLELSGRLAEQRMLMAEHPEMLVAHGVGDRRTIYDAEYSTVLPGKVVRREREAAVADRAAGEAYDNAGITYDFFERVFGRRSVDGRDMRLVSSVHYSKH
jgi:Zn-dependent metalloprotease